MRSPTYMLILGFVLGVAAPLLLERPAKVTPAAVDSSLVEVAVAPRVDYRSAAALDETAFLERVRSVVDEALANHARTQAAEHEGDQARGSPAQMLVEDDASSEIGLEPVKQAQRDLVDSAMSAQRWTEQDRTRLRELGAQDVFMRGEDGRRLFAAFDSGAVLLEATPPF